ncbi:MAG: class I SAM-dependent methyltransferase, partial [Planctomycetota bacterium]
MIEAKRLHRVCPACQHDNQTQQRSPYSRADWNIKTCERCEFVYLENPPTTESLISSEHAWEQSFVEERSRRRSERSKASYVVSDALKRTKMWVRGGARKKIIRYVEEAIDGGRVLDIGCGNGRTFRNLAEQYVPFGIEISEALAKEAGELCEPKGGRVVRAAAYDGLDEFDPEYFDG